jgi:hypothetical protein
MDSMTDSKTISMRVPTDVLERIDQAAEAHGWSRTAELLAPFTGQVIVQPPGEGRGPNKAPKVDALTAPGNPRRKWEDKKDHMGHRQKVVVGQAFCLEHQVFLNPA